MGGLYDYERVRERRCDKFGSSTHQRHTATCRGGSVCARSMVSGALGREVFPLSSLSIDRVGTSTSRLCKMTGPVIRVVTAVVLAS